MVKALALKPWPFVRRYLLNILVAFDQLLSAFTFGDPDETISSRLGRAQRGDFGRVQALLVYPLVFLVDLIFLPLDGPHHCARRIEEDEGKHAVTLRG